MCVVAGLALAGCGGSAGGASCGQLEPCGGNLQGSWVSAGSCYNPAALIAELTAPLALTCPAGMEPTIGASNANRAVSASFAADGTYSGTSTYSGVINLEISTSCLAGGGCGDLSTALGAMLNPGSGLVAAGCTGTAACSCTLTQGGSTTENGTYTTSGQVLQTTPAGGTTTSTNYCVAGSFLHFINLDTSTNLGPMGQATIVTDALLGKQ